MGIVILLTGWKRTYLQSFGVRIGKGRREMGVFGATRILEIVKKHDSGGLVWKRIKLTTTRKANAKKRLLRVWQVCLPCYNFVL